MIVAGQRLPILIATKPVDFRCGHNALALIVQTELKLDPHSGVTVVFRSKRGDRLKILVWDGTGLVLVYKVLESGSFAWLKAQAARVSRKSDLGEAMTYMLKRQDGFRLFLDDGRVDVDSNLVENAIRSPAMNRRNALFADHDEGGRNWARFASLIGTCKMNGVEPYAYLRDLFTKLANGHRARDIDALMPWAYTQRLIPSK